MMEARLYAFPLCTSAALIVIINKHCMRKTETSSAITTRPFYFMLMCLFQSTKDIRVKGMKIIYKHISG